MFVRRTGGKGGRESSGGGGVVQRERGRQEWRRNRGQEAEEKSGSPFAG